VPVDPLWTAVLTRDRSADGRFVYAVTSTGIYCRPSCASRRPGPDRVRFYPTPAAAAAAGFRACRRCRPNDRRSPEDSTNALTDVCRAVAGAPNARWTSHRLAQAGGISPERLQRAFRKALGLSPRDYVAACRRRTLLRALRSGQRTTDAIYAAGYGSPSRVYGGVQLPGMTPATYGKGGRGARIDWQAVRSRLGWILVAATPRGLCFVEMGPDRRTLLAALRDEFPAAVIAARPSRRLTALAAAARAAAEGGPASTHVPVDIRGTAFQWRVWRALTRVPRGETRSYAALAAAIGRPSAARAVARACATNPLALFVPCHRIVRGDGQLGGYRWGLEVKRRLLDDETGS